MKRLFLILAIAGGMSLLACDNKKGTADDNTENNMDMGTDTDTTGTGATMDTARTDTAM